MATQAEIIARLKARGGPILMNQEPEKPLTTKQKVVITIIGLLDKLSRYLESKYVHKNQ